MRLALRRSLTMALAALAWASAESRAAYNLTNLVSDISGLAQVTDGNLKNPWGVSYGPTGPFWVSDQASNLSTLYNGAGARQNLVVSVPTNQPPTPPNGPTGQVFNNNSADFVLSDGGGATFLFANLNGQISGWNGAAGTTALVGVPGSGAVYTGLAIARVGAHNVLYAADARGGKVDVYDNTFTNITGTTFAGKFVDPTLAAAGFRPFNVQTIGSNIYVTYDSRSNGGDAAISGGAVAVFDINGNLLRDFSNGPGGPLEDPWGVALAPSNFGDFSNDLLVGNKEAGRINAFDPTSGAFLGVVATITNDPTSTNNGLWALSFGNNGNAGKSNTLYAFAGINNEVNGLIVSVTPAPEPASIVMMGIGGAMALVVVRRRRRAVAG